MEFVANVSSGHCAPGTFAPAIFGAEILAIEASVVAGLSTPLFDTLPSFCNVTVSYEHPGLSDYITVEVWLPTETYNGRYMGIGGGGGSAGRDPLAIDFSASGLSGGFATAVTDAGLTGGSVFAMPWGLLSPGNVNIVALNNFGDVSLNEQALIAKSVIKSFYGKGPDFSYWNGCSQGGRQGLALAQRHPDAYDGILANAPALELHNIFSSGRWAYQSMVNAGSFPHECEFDAIRAAAYEACDELDGIADGIIEEAQRCKAEFDPFSLVGTAIECSTTDPMTSVEITKEAAQVMSDMWQGITTEDGSKVWYGYSPGADMTGNDPASQPVPIGLLDTDCSSGTCTGVPDAMSSDWFSRFLIRDLEVDLSTMTHAEYDDLVKYGQRYHSFFGTYDPDLSRFRKSGGKIVTAHGIDDEVIPYLGSQKYYEAVIALDPDVQDFYRYFEAPGFGHCLPRRSSGPSDLFTQLMEWVEKGKAPDSSPVRVTLPSGEIHVRIVCPYPQRARLSTCDDPARAECWGCV